MQTVPIGRESKHFGAKMRNTVIQLTSNAQPVMATSVVTGTSARPNQVRLRKDVLHIALSALHRDSTSGAICTDLRRRRAANVDALRGRFLRSVAVGDLPAGFDCEAAALFYATAQHGMSIIARDGASREELAAVADCAMAAFQPLVEKARAKGDRHA